MKLQMLTADRCFLLQSCGNPRQHSTGGKTTLLGITKGGNRYLRMLLIHGARAVLRVVDRSNRRLESMVTRSASAAGHELRQGRSGQ